MADFFKVEDMCRGGEEGGAGGEEAEEEEECNN